MRMINGYIAVKVDEHYGWYLDSSGKPFLQREPNIYDVWAHTQRSGVVVHAPESNISYLRGFSDIEIQAGDRVIFHYLAINRDIDGNDVNDKIEDLHILKYQDMYARIRDGVITPLNGWIIVKGLQEEIKTSLIIPDYIKEKKSEMICEVCYVGSPVKNHVDEPYRSFIAECDDPIHVGQKVIIPKWASVPIVKDEHDIDIGEKGVYRVRRHLCSDYDSVMNAIKDFGTKGESKINETGLAMKEFDKKIRSSTHPKEDHGVVIRHAQKTKYIREKGKVFYS